MDPDKLSDLINLGLIILLTISFIYVLFDRFFSGITLYERTILPTTDSRHLRYYIEPISNPTDPTPFPTVFDPPEVFISLVVPAYNEEKRIPLMLNETIQYLISRQSSDHNFSWEIIVVDDGSKDHTADVVLDFARQHPEIRLLRQPVNMGKGAAVQAGALHSRGQLILMVDADGATKISEIGALEKRILELMKHNKESVVVGSRASAEEIAKNNATQNDFSADDDEEFQTSNSEPKANRTPIRKFLGSMFHLLVIISGVMNIQDTQCGFKMFSREAAKWLFPNQHIQRWCFDVELLAIANRKKMEVAEVPVEWNEIPGSNIKISSMIKMAFDLIPIALFYRIGFWKVERKT